MASYRYRLTSVTTVDYGDGPASGKTITGQLAIIPDGSHWQSRPQILSIGLPDGTRPGGVYCVTIELEPQP